MPKRHVIKGIGFIILFIWLEIPVHAEGLPRPLIAIVNSNGNGSPTVRNLVNMHLSRVVATTGIFSLVNSALLQKELGKYRCLEESCILDFADTAGIDVVLIVEIEQRPGYSIVTVTSYGIGVPFFGKEVAKCSGKIPTRGRGLSVRELSYLCEEYAGICISGFLRKYLQPVKLRVGKNSVAAAIKGLLPDGTLDVYRVDGAESGEKRLEKLRTIGSLSFVKGSAHVPPGTEIRTGDFVFVGHRGKASFIEDFYYGRKKELVLFPATLNETMFAVLFTAPASASMPLMAPMGYYSSGDFGGLLLWAVNASPYLYLEAGGLINRPAEYRDRKRDIPQFDAARYRFGLYMLVAGGLPLFVDAFAHSYLLRGSRFEGRQPYMGNTVTAAYLSLVSGGAGHFYRGNRFWGYLYFHLNNILVYYAIDSFTPGERYDSTSDRYVQGSSNRTRGYYILGCLGILKIIEITHVVLSRDSIVNRSIKTSGSLVVPYVEYKPELGIVVGLKGTCRFL